MNVKERVFRISGENRWNGSLVEGDLFREKVKLYLC